MVLRSDVIRKTLCGVDELTRLPEDAYAPAMTARVYRTLCSHARAVLEAGHCVIADAVFGTTDERSQIAGIARADGAQFSGLWLAAPEDVLGNRLDARVDDASDATRPILHRQLHGISAPRDWPHLDAARAPGAVLQDAMGVLAKGS